MAEENITPQKATKAQKFALAALATTIAEPALAIAHTGGPGIIAGLIVGGFAFAYSDEIAKSLGGRGKLPLSSEGRDATEPRDKNHSSLAYRLLVGKSHREVREDGEQSLEDLYEELQASEDDCLNLGALRPHADTIFSNRVVILGMPGAGKGNLVSDFAEELGQFDAAMIIFDKKPEYGPLCRKPYLTNPFHMNARSVPPEGVYDFAQRIMDERLQVVVDLASYKSDVKAAVSMINLVTGVTAYQEVLPNEKRIPCTFVLEEAHYWLPESEGQSTIRSVKQKDTGEPLLPMLQQTFFNLSSIGRSLGMGLIVSTQRPANVDKRLISAAEWRFLLKAMEPADLSVYKKYGLEAEQAMKLEPGQAYVIGPNTKDVYQIRRRKSPDEAKTPGLENIRNSRKEQTAWPTSIPASVSTSETDANLHVLDGAEVAKEVARSGNEVGEVGEVGNSALSEREKHIAEMFYLHRQGINDIIRELWPGVTGGSQYQKANAEIADALRKYAQAQ